MGFPQADATEEDNIGLVFKELQSKQVLHLESINLFRPGPVKLLESFEGGEAGEFNASLHSTILAQQGFAFHEAIEIMNVGVLLLSGLLGQGLEVFLCIGQFQVRQMVKQWLV